MKEVLRVQELVGQHMENLSVLHKSSQMKAHLYIRYKSDH